MLHTHVCRMARAGMLPAKPVGGRTSERRFRAQVRRIVSFGELDAPESDVPTRKGRFSLPGGKPAFAPGWDAPPDEPPEPQAAAQLAVDGREVLNAPFDLPALGAATVRLAEECLICPASAALACTILKGGTQLALARVEPPTGEDEWLPTGKRDMVSHAVDVPGFTVCFDAKPGPPSAAADGAQLDSDSSSPAVYALVSLRIVRHGEAGQGNTL
jgi:hypothetical protein